MPSRSMRASTEESGRSIFWYTSSSPCDSSPAEVCDRRRVRFRLACSGSNVELAVEVLFGESHGTAARRVGAEQERVEHNVVHEAVRFDAGAGEVAHDGFDVVRRAWAVRTRAARGHWRCP